MDQFLKALTTRHRLIEDEIVEEEKRPARTGCGFWP